MDSSFPLLKLAFIPMKLIISRLNPVEVIELTMMSEKFKKQMTQMKYHVSNFKWNMSSNECKISFCIDSITCSFIARPFPEKQNVRKTRKIDGTSFEVVTEKDTWSRKFYISGKTEMKILEKVTSHCLGLLKVKNFNLNLDAIPRNFKIRDSFLWKFTKQFDNFVILPVKPMQVSSEEQRFILEELSTKVLSLDVKVKGSKGIQTLRSIPLKSKSVCIYTRNWINVNNLLAWDCSSIQIEIKTGLLTIVERFLENWMDSDNEKLRDVTFFGDVKIDRRKLQGLFNSVNATPTTISKEQFYFRDVYCSSTILEFRRKTDGRRATMCLEDDKFVMHVWTEQEFQRFDKFNRF